MKTTGNKKIAFVVSRFPVISETFILNQVTGFIKEGRKVTILTQIVEQWDTVHESIKRFNLKKYTRCYTHSFSNKNVARIFAAANLFYSFFFCPRKALRTLKLSIQNRKTFSYSSFFLALSILRSKAEIVFCQFGFNGVIAIFLKQIAPEIKLVVMFHGYDTRLPIFEAERKYQKLFYYADIILANSEHTFQNLLRFGSPSEKTTIYYLGVDTEKFSKHLQKMPLKNDEIIILSICRLVKEKGLVYGLYAFDEVVRKSSQKVLYHIVGDGPLMNELKALAVSLKIEKNVVFWGAKTQEEVVEFYNQADIFFLPSDEEAFGVVLLEAQAMQLPIVATNTGGISDAVIENESAFLVSIHDSCTMAEKLLFLIDRPDRRIKMGQAGLIYVKRKFDSKTTNKKLLNLLETVC